MDLQTAHPTRFAWLSVVIAISIIFLKVTAYWLTGSVGLLSDALESGVNLIAALIALFALTVAASPADSDHAFGHYKAEYFSSGVEGALIVVAAILIIWSSLTRFLSPQPLEQVDIGLLISGVATVVNLVTARVLLAAGQRHHSVALEADAHHLMTDVWTSLGVMLGVGLTSLTNWYVLDPIVAIVVAIHITVVGIRLVWGAVKGLMDTALPAKEIDQIESILNHYREQGVTYHALRTRRSGRQRFVSVHIQVPGQWTVQKGHILLEEIEKHIRQKIAPISILTHLEPIEDPISWADIELER